VLSDQLTTGCCVDRLSRHRLPGVGFGSSLMRGGKEFAKNAQENVTAFAFCGLWSPLICSFNVFRSRKLSTRALHGKLWPFLVG
jgi:hypothetical protein